MSNPFRKSRSDTFYTARMIATNWPANDLCDPPTPTDVAFDYLVDELLGSDWHVTMPENKEQTNTAAIAAILKKYIDRPKRTSDIWWCYIAAAFFFGVIAGMLLSAF